MAVGVWQCGSKQPQERERARENRLRKLRFFKITRRIRIWRKIPANPVNITLDFLILLTQEALEFPAV
jgi:hypothetical protein